jgi:hypothetical protein
LSANTKYKFSIVAVNAGGSSASSTNTIYSNLSSASLVTLSQTFYYDSTCGYYNSTQGKIGKNNWVYGNNVNLVDAPALTQPDINSTNGIGYAAIQNNTIGIHYSGGAASVDCHLTNNGGVTWNLVKLPNTNPWTRIWAKNNYFFEIDFTNQSPYSASARYSTSGSVWTTFPLPFVANSANLFTLGATQQNNQSFFTYVNGYYVFATSTTDVYSTSATPTAWTSSTVWSKNVFPLATYSLTNTNRGYYGYASGTYFSFATASSGAANTIMVSTNASTWFLFL